MGWPAAIPAIIAGAGVVGSAISGADANRQSEYLSKYGAEFAADEAYRQRAWQENMSNTAHQREVTDLQKAGLNPTLSAGGNGSSTPSGAMGSYSAPPVVQPNYMAALGGLADVIQRQETIDIQKNATDEAIAKSKADRGYTGVKTENEKKNMPKNQMIHDFWELLQKSGKGMTDVYKKMNQKPTRQQIPGFGSPNDLPTQPLR